MDARNFDTINDILRYLSLVQSLLKGRNTSIWRQRAPTPLRLSGTDGLSVTKGTSSKVIALWLQGVNLGPP